MKSRITKKVYIIHCPPFYIGEFITNYKYTTILLCQENIITKTHIEYIHRSHILL